MPNSRLSIALRSKVSMRLAICTVTEMATECQWYSVGTKMAMREGGARSVGRKLRALPSAEGCN